MTVLESIKLSTEYFEKKGIEAPRANAEILLAHILKCKRLDLYLSFDKPLKDEEVIIFREYLKRRARFEPLQYIVGDVEFYGLTFKVNPSVLIPRQETEILVETIISNLDKECSCSILDIGTGTGNIPITLAKYLPAASFTTVDVSAGALYLGKENAKLNEVEDQIIFVEGNILDEGFNIVNKFDVIVSNPPYVALDEYKTLQAEILDFEPGNAVTDFSDGFTFYRKISARAEKLLKTNGKLFFEVGKGQSDVVAGIMRENNFTNISIKKDYLNIERVIYGELICEL
ncbi:MAG: peptide chain release factor N(5)-glutamine methyltransferase [Ignavibacteriales bacterium]